MARRKYSEIEKNLMKEISRNLRRILFEKGMSQRDLAEKTGLAPSTISDYLNAKTLISPGNTHSIAVALGVDKSEIDSSMKSEDDEKGVKNIPLYGSVSCGNGVVVFEDLIGYIETPREYARGGEYFYMRAKGDSMINAHIPDGALLLVRKQPDVEDGEIAVVAVGDEVVLKRVFRREGLIFLQSENPDYPPIIKSQKDDVRIVGKLKKAIIDF